MINAELKSFEDLASSFAHKELAPNREMNDKYPFGPFFDGALNKAYEVGFLGITLPEDLGGIGQGISTLCVVLEGICQADSSLGAIIFTNAFSQEIFLAAGAQEILSKITSNAKKAKESLIASPVFTNPSEMKLTVEAKKDKNSYTLSGSLEYLVLGSLAQYALIPAKIQNTYSFFLVDLADRGISKSDVVFSLGLHACPAVDLTLTNVKAEIVGKEGQGAIYFEDVANKLSVAAAAMSLGVMKGSFNEAFEYTKTRFQGGREILNWSEVRMILSDMAIKIKASELALTTACQAVESKAIDWDLCSRAAALHIQSLACDLTTDGIQLLGGYGYMKDYGQEKRFRDAKHMQALLGITPMKRMKYIKKIIGE